MSDELNERLKRLRQLSGGAPSREKQLRDGSNPAQRLERLLTGSDNPSQRLLTSGDVEGAAREEAKGTLVRIYLLCDTTASMMYTVTEMQRQARAMGSQLFREGAHTEMTVWGLQDHYVNNGIRYVRTPNNGVIQAPLVNNAAAFERQICRLTSAPNNRDSVENYADGWHLAAIEIATASKPKEYQHTKYVAITFMETAPHGMLAEIGFPNEQQEFDTGSPSGVHWRTARDALQGLVDQWYIVDCKGQEGYFACFTEAKRICAQYGARDGAQSNHNLVSLGESSQIIAPLICAMTEKARGPASYAQHLEKLRGSGQRQLADSVVGYLGPGASLVKK